MKNLSLMIFIIILAWSCQTGNQPVKETSKVASGLADTLRYPQEAHLANMHQLTFGGDNAEAYFSFNSKMIAFQSNKLPQRISNGMGAGQPALISCPSTQPSCSLLLMPAVNPAPLFRLHVMTINMSGRFILIMISTLQI